ncbi:MAG: sulfotransferase family protein [Pseudohaliea sp.]
MLPSALAHLKVLCRLNARYLEAVWQRRRTSRLAGTSQLPEPEAVLASPHVFVLSTGRCGTALLTRILARADSLQVEHSPKPELEYVSSLVHRDEPSLEALKLAVLASRFDTQFLDCYRRGKRYVETNNRISLFAPALAELLPRSRFIHLVRDPAAFVRSGMCRGYYLDGVVQHQRLNAAHSAEWRAFSRLEKIVWEWNEINGRVEQFKAGLEPGRMLTVKSEELFEDPGVTSGIFDFLEVDNPFAGERGLRRLENYLSTPVNRQKSLDFPRYAAWDSRDKAALKRIATLAPRYGYHLDG